jgi:hypothetical protein
VPHATAEQLAAYTGQPAPADADRLLQRATETVDRHVLVSYDVEAQTGLAVDAAKAAALRDATCAQVEYWQECAEEDDILGAPAALQVGPLRVDETHTGPLAPRARRHLALAGLLSGAVGL